MFFFLAFFTESRAQNLPFRKTDKGPYGTYVLYDQLPVLFPDATLSFCYHIPYQLLQLLYFFCCKYSIQLCDG